MHISIYLHIDICVCRYIFRWLNFFLRGDIEGVNTDKIDSKIWNLLDYGVPWDMCI